VNTVRYCSVSYWSDVLCSCANSEYHLQVLNELIAASHDDVCVMTTAMLDKAHLLYKTNSSDSSPQ